MRGLKPNRRRDRPPGATHVSPAHEPPRASPRAPNRVPSLARSEARPRARHRKAPNPGTVVGGYGLAKTDPFDPAQHLPSPEAQHALLNDAPSTADASYVAHSLGIIARARFTSETAREAGITREALYRSLSEDGDPRLTTLLGVMRALGVRLTAVVGPAG